MFAELSYKPVHVVLSIFFLFIMIASCAAGIVIQPSHDALGTLITLIGGTTSVIALLFIQLDASLDS